MIRSAALPESARQTAGVLFWLVLLVAAYFVPRGTQANADSHLALTYAIVERGTVRIDHYAPVLLDKAVYCGEQTTVISCHKFYSDKAPGISLLAAAVYLPLHFVLPTSMMPANPTNDRYLLRYLLTLLIISLPFAAFVATLYLFLVRYVAPPIALLTSLGYAFGTLAFPFSTLLFSHVLAASLLFWAFMLIQRVSEGGNDNVRSLLAAGALAGFSAACEYPTAIIVVFLGAYCLAVFPGTTRFGSAANFVAGACLGFTPALAYNVIAFGAPLSQGYAHLTNSYYASGMSHGILGVTLPTWDAVWGTSFSPFRGLFFLSPWLLLAVPGIYSMSRATRGLARIAILSASIGLVYFLFQSGYAFWNGGASVGPRHFLPALPFLVLPVAISCEHPAARRAAQVLIALSIAALALVVATNPLFGDPHYVGNMFNPLIDQTLHDVRAGQWQNNIGMLLGLPGVASFLPLAIGVALLVRRLSGAARA